jgi:YHS domain-containing protein
MGRILDLLFDLATALIVVRMLAGAVRGLFKPGSTHFTSPPGAASQGEKPPASKTGETVRDPVCGMFVSTELSHSLRSHGKVLYFCSEECLERYRKSASE